MSEAPGGAAPRSSSGPSTTFVQLADATTFKEVVQRLTGRSSGGGGGGGDLQHNPPPSFPLLPNEASGSSNSAKLSGGKRLHERWQPFRQNLAAAKAAGSQSLPATPAGSLSPAMSPLVLSPSARFTNLKISHADIVESIAASRDQAAKLNQEEEDRAIKERRFYLHPSPRSRTRVAEPELLPLFPMSSPKPREP